MLQVLTDADLNYVPEPPVFESLAAGILGDAEQWGQSVDFDLLTAASVLGAEPDEGSAMDAALAGAAFQAGAFEGSNYSPIAQDYGSFVPGLDGQMGNFAGGVAGGPAPGGPGPKPKPPDPPKQPPPPGGSGGHGGGPHCPKKGTTGGPLGCG